MQVHVMHKIVNVYCIRNVDINMKEMYGYQFEYFLEQFILTITFDLRR